ncbi:PaaI family thioesterase [Montanilutibacter psychrotolerans]|uniref:PaaI family thioesterase n=1 Tax=Montanilutibacter psychrotolerans TaxID=1327343 RepID=A0A3M8SVV0_9GAMM|nr:PaaI family thioesterase [Lysobacter psychrotolerans]RNF83586.1 PaaI family thioesterase [Lysobacter psychrotolerans]
MLRGEARCLICNSASPQASPPRGADVLTVEFKINFVRPAVADRSVAIGKVTKAGKTLTVCQGEVIGEQGTRRETIAVMQATINVPGNT